MNLYPPDIPQLTLNDISLRQILCHFLSCALFITQARNSTDIELQLQHYLSVRKHAKEFYPLVPLQLIRFDSAAKTDLLNKNRSILAFDFEAAAKLKAWDVLREVLDQGAEVADEKVYGIFADVLLASEAPLATKGFLLMVR
jgi:hypothetical protein